MKFNQYSLVKIKLNNNKKVLLFFKKSKKLKKFIKNSLYRNVKTSNLDFIKTKNYKKIFYQMRIQLIKINLMRKKMILK